MKGRRILLLLILTIVVILFSFFSISKCGLDSTLSLAKYIALIIAFFLAVFITLNYSPIISCKISATWVDKENNQLLIKTEIENISKVLAIVAKDGIRIQILKQTTNCPKINEWVAFEEGKTDRMIPKPSEWTPPEIINISTGHLYPGDVVRTERIFNIQIKENEVLHLGLQFKLARGPLSLWISEQWTTTKFVFRDNKNNRN